MECTQRLECTQDLYDTHTERICPEQIGFLGILGAKHPVLKGPNKIGRDPQTCQIVLNLSKTLQPYIPHPLKNGDTVQFGDIFGIFRLLEEDNELPMTQALDNIPETPILSRFVSKLNKAPTTMIPESPDVSDKDDSFVTPTQPKLSNSHFIKPFGKVLSIHSVKTDSRDSKRSSSSSITDKHDRSMNDSFISLKCDKKSIHEMDTQQPDIVHNANVTDDNIFSADTQIPQNNVPSPSIHSLDTQVPMDLPQIRKINNQQEMQFDIYAANKENDLSIFNAETQPFYVDKNDSIDGKINVETKNVVKDTTSEQFPNTVSQNKSYVSEEEILFDEIDDECLEDFNNSQNLLPAELPFEVETPKTKEKSPILPDRTAKNQSPKTNVSNNSLTDLAVIPKQKITMFSKDVPIVSEGKSNPKSAKRTGRILSDSSTDCDDLDMQPTQIVQKLDDVITDAKHNTKKLNKRNNRIDSDSSTDCEGIDLILPQKGVTNKVNNDDDATDCEDDVIEIKPNKPSKNEDIPFEDMLTQVIELEPPCVDKPALEDMPTQIIDTVEVSKSDLPAFEDLATQVIDTMENVSNKPDIDFEATQIVEEIVSDKQDAAKSPKDIISPFKVPLQSAKKVKNDVTKLSLLNKSAENKSMDDEDNYYNTTQDIYEDLCSQRESSPEIVKISPMKVKASDIVNDNDDIVPCSVEDYKVGDRFANIEIDSSPNKHKAKGAARKLVSNPSLLLVKELGVSKLRKVPSGLSDSSDVESTPKKTRPFFFSDSDLPNSQEIKTSVMVHSKTALRESSSESESEQHTEEKDTPFLHRVKAKKPVAKIDLTKKFEVEKLPERVITRKRKPTAKVMENQAMASNILKPKFLTEQDDNVDSDIITENIKRLKTYEKAKNGKDNTTIQEEKRDKIPSTKEQSKSSEPKEKIKVKIERPPKRESKSKKSKNDSKRKSNEEEKDITVKTEEKGKTKDSSRTSKYKETTSTSSRTTRSKKKVDEDKPESKRESSGTKKDDSKRKRSSKKDDTYESKTKSKPAEKARSKSPEVVVRRSRRQQNAKEKEKDEQKDDSLTMKAPKSILKKSIHEQSTVYNISTSSSDSPKGIKRSLGEDSDVPTKRARNSNNNSVVSNNSSNITQASLRATPVRLMKTHHVLFTAFPSEEVKQKLEKLGAVVVTDVMTCSVVLTMAVKRTFKLLCAMGLGKPIVGPSWVQACVDTHMIVDPWMYLIKDEAAEKRFQFNLECTLNGRRNFLKGYNVSSTASVQPNATEMKLIVECSGGMWKEGGTNWVCVTSTKDKALWPSLKKRGATLVSTEFILGGVLRQKVEIANNEFK